jgi:diaminohydroxyphosphoribosylaminopyrimidine deaminase / 5-amino-6-(5-phosphoribosylamino)uracil reductase
MAIAVGAQTIRVDNPKLTVRLPNYEGAQPIRLVFSHSGQLPESAYVFNDEYAENTRIYGNRPLSEVLDELYQQGIVNILLEGGAGLASAFLAESHVQRISHYLNPSYLGQGISALNDYGLMDLSQRIHLKHVEYTALGEDFHLTGRV